MNILTKYISKTIVTYVFLVVFILIGIEIFIEFTREFRDIGTGDYGILQVLIYVPMMLPLDIYQLFPMAGLLGSIIALGLLASHSELIVVRASGMSITEITIAVMKASIMLIFVIMILGEVIAPFSQHQAVINKATQMSSGQALVTRQGIWVRRGMNFIHINQILPEGKLQGITRYLFNDQHQLKLASYAKEGIYQHGQWLFKDVAQTNFGINTTASSHFANQQWEFTLKPKLLGISITDTNQRSLVELLAYIKYRQQSGLGVQNYQFAFWQRVFQPLASLVMILLAIPFVFGPLRGVTMGLRLVTGMMVGFGFYLLNQFAGPMSVVYQVPPILAALLPTVLFAGIGGFLLMKVK